MDDQSQNNNPGQNQPNSQNPQNLNHEAEIKPSAEFANEVNNNPTSFSQVPTRPEQYQNQPLNPQNIPTTPSPMLNEAKPSTSMIIKIFITFIIAGFIILVALIVYNKYFANKVHQVESKVVGTSYVKKQVSVAGQNFDINFDKSAYSVAIKGSTDTDLKGVDLAGNPLILVIAPTSLPNDTTVNSCQYPSGYTKIGTVTILDESESICGFNATSSTVANNLVLTFFEYNQKWYSLTLHMINTSQSVDLSTADKIASSITPA